MTKCVGICSIQIYGCSLPTHGLLTCEPPWNVPYPPHGTTKKYEQEVRDLYMEIEI